MSEPAEYPRSHEMEISDPKDPLTYDRSSLVSVIVPTYNYGHFVGQTLESILAQTYKNWECIVVDDGSKDNTRRVVADYVRRDSRIRYIHQRNKGLSAARNKGLRRLRGQYIQFLDSDDLIEHGKLELHVRYLQEHPEINIVYGAVRYFRTEAPDQLRYSMNENDVPWMPEISGKGSEILKVVVERNIMAVSAPLLRRGVIEAVGYFDTQLKVLEDWHYWIRCAISGKHIKYLDLENTRTLVRWHTRSMSIERERMNRGEIPVRRKIMGSLGDAELETFNRTIVEDFDQKEREAKIQQAIAQVKSSECGKAFHLLVSIGWESQSNREMAKWFFCALLAPFAPKDDFETVIAAPAGESILKALRYQFSGRQPRF